MAAHFGLCERTAIHCRFKLCRGMRKRPSAHKPLKLMLSSSFQGAETEEATVWCERRPGRGGAVWFSSESNRENQGTYPLSNLPLGGLFPLLHSQELDCAGWVG